MDQVTTLKRRLRNEEWRKIIQDCQSSGIPVYRWCKENGICEQTYYKYLKRIRQEICDALPVPIKPDEEKPVVLKKLEVQAPIQNTKAAVIIRLPQATLEISEGTSQQTIQAVLLALQSIC